MIDPADVPPVDSDEAVARFVLYSKHVRQDGTVKPDAFVPHPHQDLSVTRLRLATDPEVWSVGVQVALVQKRTLYGRADLAVSVFERQNLCVEADPVDGNPNHANVVGWPADKPLQKSIAQELAASRPAYHTAPTG